MAADGYVAIHRTTDVAQGELLAETLRGEGIDARFHRVSSALIGVPTSMIEMTVDVPLASEARARELLRDLEYLGAAERAAEASAPEAGGRAEEVRRYARRAVLAPGFALLLPAGGGHLYARRPWTALVIGLGAIACLAAV